jgi:hypothetical protein
MILVGQPEGLVTGHGWCHAACIVQEQVQQAAGGAGR